MHGLQVVPCHHAILQQLTCTCGLTNDESQAQAMKGTCKDTGQGSEQRSNTVAVNIGTMQGNAAELGASAAAGMPYMLHVVS